MIKIGKTNFSPKDLIFTFAMIISTGLVTGFFLQNMQKADASRPTFDPGRIIDDATMSDYRTMSVSDIQRFLESKNRCNDRNIEKAKKYNKYKYHIKNGKFVCLAEETFDGKTAAQIIHAAAQKYRINPQVLIVLLEKEQGLITDTWPNNIQYRSATGFGCPDTDVCSKKYYGFANQLNHAAKLFREVLDGGYTNFPLGYNSINYHPNNNCGSSRVKIKNLATSALYRYTPYQPNTASLSAGYGRGNRCSSYGNRNFFLYFNDWFGSSLKSNRSDSVLTSYDTPSPAIKDGIYYIGSRDYLGRYADVVNFGTKDLVNIQAIPLAKNTAQKFYLKYHPSGGYYTMTNVHSGRNINLRATKSGSNIYQYRSTGNCDERWFLDKRSSNAIKVYSYCDRNLTMAIENNHGRLNIFATSDSSSVKGWDFIPEGSLSHATSSNTGRNVINSISNTLSQENQDGEEYYIVSRINHNFGLDVSYPANAGGNRIQLWRKIPNNLSQTFRIKQKPNSKMYTIQNTRSGLYLDAINAGTKNNTKLQQWYKNGSCAQDWELIKLPDGYYKIRSGCSNLVLDVYYGDMFSGNTICLWQDQNLEAQKWKLVKK